MMRFRCFTGIILLPVAPVGLLLVDPTAVEHQAAGRVDMYQFPIPHTGGGVAAAA
jgi:hypothetical protein